MKQYVGEICDNIGQAVFQFVVWGYDYDDALRTANNLKKTQYKNISGYVRVSRVE